MALKAFLSKWAIAILICNLLPVTLAAPTTATPFPDISFAAFSQVIAEQFNHNISLATVMRGHYTPPQFPVNSEEIP